MSSDAYEKLNKVSIELGAAVKRVDKLYHAALDVEPKDTKMQFAVDSLSDLLMEAETAIRCSHLVHLSMLLHTVRFEVVIKLRPSRVHIKVQIKTLICAYTHLLHSVNEFFVNVIAGEFRVERCYQVQEGQEQQPDDQPEGPGASQRGCPVDDGGVRQEQGDADQALPQGQGQGQGRRQVRLAPWTCSCSIV